MVHATAQDGLIVLRMDSGKVQALDIELVDDLSAALDAAARSGSPPLVLTGTGSSFCAGVDLFRVVEGGGDYVARFLPALSAALLKLFTYPGPVVTALNGHAIAGGALLAWCGDVRLLASGKGRIGVPELRVGVPFPAAAIEILRFATGGRGLQALAFVGGTMPPDEARAAGLIDEVVPAELLVEHARGVAASLGSIPSASFALTKRAIRRPHIESLAAGAEALDREVIAIWQTPATMSAVHAYLQRTFGSR